MPQSQILTASELSSRIATGEVREFSQSNVELKRKWDSDFGRKISGLANRSQSSRAWLVIGVNDDGTLAGFDENWADQTNKTISEHLNKYLDPASACEKLYSESINGKWVVILEIVNPGAVVRWDGRAWKMPGTSASEMSPAEVTELTVALPGLSDFTAQAWSGQVNLDLVETYARMLIESGAEPNWLDGVPRDQILSRLGLRNRLVSRLLFGESKFRVVKYSEPDEIASNEVRKGLLHIVSAEFREEVQAWAKKFHAVDAPYSDRSLKETFANCVAHAAYFENDGEIIVEVFPDRLTASNLCLPEVEYFANKWFSSGHKTVNRLLTEALREIKVVDELGRGKSRIFTESILGGHKPPYVDIEKAGRFSRWKLTVFDGESDPRLKKLLVRLQEQYRDRKKAMLSIALVLWRDHKLDDIRAYLDSESRSIVAEILSDLNGPVFFYSETGKVVLRRWVRLLVEEGRESKSLSPSEESDLFNFMYDVQTKFAGGFIRPAEFRRLAQMSDSKAESVLCSNILKKWVEEDKLEKVKTGLYKFKKVPLSVPGLEDFLKSLSLPDDR